MGICDFKVPFGLFEMYIMALWKLICSLISSLLIIVYQNLYIHIQNLRYLKQYLQTWLPPVANVWVDHAEALAELFRQPCLFDTTFFKHFFYSVHGSIHCLSSWFCLQRCKILCYKKEKRKKNSPSSLKFIQMPFNQALIASNGAA